MRKGCPTFVATAFYFSAIDFAEIFYIISSIKSGFSRLAQPEKPQFTGA